MASQTAPQAAATTTSTSRLGQMQMRFQQKQMQEREQRRLELTEHVNESKNTTNATRNIGNGKVRQMFDERRRGIGIDRSHPLKPIASNPLKTNSRNTTSLSTNTNSTTTIRRFNNNNMNNLPNQSKTKASLSSQRTLNNAKPFGISSFDECDMLCNETFPNELSLLNLNDNCVNDNDDDDYNNNLQNKRNATMTKRPVNATKPTVTSRNNSSSTASSGIKSPPQNGTIKLNPIVTKKSPNLAKPKTTVPKTTSAATTRSSVTPMRNGTPRTSTVNRKVTSPTKKGDTSNRPNVTPQPGMGACRYCYRHFLLERLNKHEQICVKMAQTKRRIFDAARHRIKGTDAEKYFKKTRSITSQAKGGMAYTSAVQFTGGTVGGKKNNWRQRHAEFIAAIRAAKQLKVHLARGGKLSDLPPPPPSENPDYIQCPHCKRRFNEAAAERHIPKCATMLHNKPKLNQQGRRR